MSAPNNTSWHTTNGGALPFRPPTVDEALPYSPFSSVVPFSPDIIPFPSAEPPPPPSTLTPEQQEAARKSVGILDAEIRGPPKNARYLQHTLSELQTLLNPNDLSQFQFKTNTQLVTPPPDSPTKPITNGSGSSKTLGISLFASMLLKNIDVAYIDSERLAERVRSKQPKQPVPRPVPQPDVATPNRAAYNQNASVQYPQVSVSPSDTSSTQRTISNSTRPGPAVIIPKQAPVRREEYRRYDNLETDDGLSQKRKREDDQADDEALAMRSQQREIADQKTQELLSLINKISEAKEMGVESGMYMIISTDEAEYLVVEGETQKRLHTATMNVIRSGTFMKLPVEDVLRLQSLTDASIMAAAQLSIDLREGEIPDWLSSLEHASSGLRACRLALETMTKGPNEQRTCSEDLVRSIVNALKHVLDSCIIPIVVARREGEYSELFKLALQYKDFLTPILSLCGHVLGLLAKLIGKVNLTETALTPIEYLSTGIVFVQNGENEKESALGIQKFELFRHKAMDVLAQIFACHPDQRDFISNEILSNLEKLPEKRGSARQFRQIHGPPIMLVSALFMRIIQAAASRTVQEKRSATQVDEAESSADEDEEDSDYGKENRASAKFNSKKAQERLQGSLSKQLHDGSTAVATKITHFLVNRAVRVSKAGDSPFRNLLHLFIEDFCNVLGSPEWPAAVELLNLLCSRMIRILDHNNKEPTVNDKYMALSELGSMACGITDFRTRMKNYKRNLDISQSDVSNKLVRLAEDAFGNGINNVDLLAFDGPYRIVLESLQDYLKVASREDPNFQAVNGCHITHWAYTFSKEFTPNDSDPIPQAMVILGRRLNKMVENPEWLHDEFETQNVQISDVQSQLAAGLLTMQNQFCQLLNHLVQHFINHASRNPSPKLRSGATQSLSDLITKDPTTLDEQTFRALNTLAADASPMVRQNYLAMISKSLEQDPTLEQYCLPSILKLVADPATGPKKSAIKMLKDMYFGLISNDKKLEIAWHLLVPVQDDDKGVAELARQILEDIWLARPASGARQDESQLRLDRRNRVSLLVRTVQNSSDDPRRMEALRNIFAGALSSKSKNTTTNIAICRDFVADMMEDVIGTGLDEQARILVALSIFAEVSPRLFTPAQVQLLKPYVQNVKQGEIPRFRPTVVILRYVLPAISSLPATLLGDVRGLLLGCVSVVAKWVAQHPPYKPTLIDIAHCLWTVSPLVENGLESLVGLVCSSIAWTRHETESWSKDTPLDQKIQIRLNTYLLIMGVFGKVCHFDNHIDIFKKKMAVVVSGGVRQGRFNHPAVTRLASWSGNSVSVLLLDSVRPLTMQAWAMGIRERALSSLGEICQRSPKQFIRADVERAFKLVFLNQDNTVLKRVVLTQFRDFFSAAERRSETGAEIAVGEGAVHGSERLDTSMVASDNDGATIHLAQKFLGDIVELALGKEESIETRKQEEEITVIATDIIISVSRQGLVHPKECGPALIALATSTNPKISARAAEEHQSIHHKHETMFEKEYMAAVSLAYKYQCAAYQDPHGAIERTCKPKLQHLNEALKSGTRKVFKKFLTNLCKKIDFDLTSLDTTGTIPECLLFARFCLENIGFFDYAHNDEVQHLISTIQDIVFKQTGPSVALAIENDIIARQQQLQVENQQVDANMNGEGSLIPQAPQPPTASPVSETRLRQITVASMILQMMWETRTFLRRQWNLLAKVTAKDIQKTTVKNNLIPGKDLWDKLDHIMSSLSSPEAMTNQCFAFGHLIDVDSEARIGEDEASEQLARAAAGYETPDEGGDADAVQAPASGKGRKRKADSKSASTPKKTRVRPSGGAKKKRTSKTPEENEDWD
ncbi:sister chromatid cohesion C-terminus-domain-containing protein [Clohesyomyces aquaticus]|uniref:Sister chromatid cohesion protein n=1 Tax=Clohesyomyces aquaticus TaxID=1231657 RepID=A0A1Y1YCR9_9PLEO|nr:sister chromatid cohesion C-terminus-domain-containing protein [Clohesyomyces aquaticus]